jgi:hypothetical protein
LCWYFSKHHAWGFFLDDGVNKNHKLVIVSLKNSENPCSFQKFGNRKIDPLTQILRIVVAMHTDTIFKSWEKGSTIVEHMRDKAEENRGKQTWAESMKSRNDSSNEHCLLFINLFNIKLDSI